MPDQPRCLKCSAAFKEMVQCPGTCIHCSRERGYFLHVKVRGTGLGVVDESTYTFDTEHDAEVAQRLLMWVSDNQIGGWLYTSEITELEGVE